MRCGDSHSNDMGLSVLPVESESMRKDATKCLVDEINVIGRSSDTQVSVEMNDLSGTQALSRRLTNTVLRQG